MEENFALNLKEYIEQDKIYQDYKKRKLENKSDFDEFCINHCEDIENALDELLKLRIKISAMDTINNELDNENQELKEEFEKLWDEYNKLKDKYDKDIEHLGKIADDYRDKNKELKSLCNKYEEEHKTTFEEWKKDINIIDELEKWLKEDLKQQYRDCGHRNNIIREVYNKLNELKGE